VGTSIVELQTGSASVGGNAVQATRSAWRAVGRPGRCLTLTGLLACVLVAAWWAPRTPAALATGATLLVLCVAALVDAVWHRLPNTLVGTAAVPVLAAVVAAWSGSVLRSAAVGAAFLGVPLLATHLVSPGAMGFGDVKAGAVAGAALGLVAAPLALLALVLGLALGACLGLARRAAAIALGPALVAGALLALIVGRLAGVDAVSP
jgi:leader peptidase (prepilin peptidase)/N-methyltransferase